MKEHKQRLKWLIWITAACCILPVLFYCINFPYGVSTSPATWGTFGDFFGGILNPIIGLLNLAAIIYLGYYVSMWDDRRHKNEFLYEAYKDLAENLNSPSINDEEKFDYLYAYIETFKFNNTFLFDNDQLPIFQNCCDTLKSSIGELSAYELIYGYSTIEAKPEQPEQIKTLVQKYNKLSFRYKHRLFGSFAFERANTLSFLQQILAGNDYSDYALDKVIERKSELDKEILKSKNIFHAFQDLHLTTMNQAIQDKD